MLQQNHDESKTLLVIPFSSNPKIYFLVAHNHLDNITLALIISNCLNIHLWVQQIALHSISSHQYTYLTFRRIFSRVRPQLQTRRNSNNTNKLRTIRDTAIMESAITQRLSCSASRDPCEGHWITPEKILP